MKWLWVGAFTDFEGLRYRNPVHFSAHFSNFHVILGFVGLVYYTGGFPGVTLEFRLGSQKSGCLEAGKVELELGSALGYYIRYFNI